MTDYVRAMAELAVRFGANVQAGQIVALQSAPGREELARAIAGVAYEQGAKFVDISVHDPYLKRARIMHADPETLSFVPPWIGARVLALGEERAAWISMTGPVAPHALEGLDPALVGRDRLPSVAESQIVVNGRTSNWTIVPGPTPAWAALLHPSLPPDEALELLWEEIAFACRLNEPDPVAAWTERLARLSSVVSGLNGLALDELRFEGPGTSLRVGLLPSSRWMAGELTTVDGIAHQPNIPTEEVYTTPDPERVDGVVRASKPLFTAGALIQGIRVRFEDGRAVEIDADDGGEVLRTLAARDAGAARLGEVALVDRESRVGQLGRVFYDTLLDENAASHIALGSGLLFAVGTGDEPRVNESELHIDFMIGSDDVAVTGITRDGHVVPLLREGSWQI